MTNKTKAILPQSMSIDEGPWNTVRSASGSFSLRHQKTLQPSFYQFKQQKKYFDKRRVC